MKTNTVVEPTPKEDGPKLERLASPPDDLPPDSPPAVALFLYRVWPESVIKTPLSEDPEFDAEARAAAKELDLLPRNLRFARRVAFGSFVVALVFIALEMAGFSASIAPEVAVALGSALTFAVLRHASKAVRQRRSRQTRTQGSVSKPARDGRDDDAV